jgi:hypothetical protein
MTTIIGKPQSFQKVRVKGWLSSKEVDNAVVGLESNGFFDRFEREIGTAGSLISDTAEDTIVVTPAHQSKNQQEYLTS